MKKILVLFILVFVGNLFLLAQDPDSLMIDLAKNEGAMRQIIDQTMLKSSLDKAATQDPSEGPVSKKKSFLQKIDSMEVITLEDQPSEVSDTLLNSLDQLKDNNGFTTLIKVRDSGDNVQIIAKKDGESISNVYIFVVDESDIVAVKMNGILTQSDLEDIIKEQTKNKK